ncbi:MAG: pirin family protein [Cyanobacteria bacterium J06621_8]
MMKIRPAKERGGVNFGWLDSKHTFSFGSYYDPNHMGFGKLRVINEDKVKSGQGFGTHRHRDMEIISYVLSGELEHQDSIGNGSVIRPGDVQRMSAGTGIAHSEFNGSTKDLVHFLQIWIVPETSGIPPSYEQKNFPITERQGRLKLVASGDGRDDSVTINQDASLYVAVLNEKETVTYNPNHQRSIWIQIAKGSAIINGQAVNNGDGVAITQENAIAIAATKDNTEILLFDLA